LGGCAIVAAVLVALVVGVLLAVGWQLTRDESPGRAVETLLIGDETRYYRIDLKADDPGLMAMMSRFNEINDERRRELLRGTFLEHIPLPSRKARLSEFAPLTLEIALVMSDPADPPQTPIAWTARGTLSRGLLKMRAALKLLGWVARPRADEAKAVDVDGIAVTRVGPGFALATVGNRVLVASDGDRMRSVLQSATESTPPQDPRLTALRESIQSEGDDAWAFATDLVIGEASQRKRLGPAAASFDVTEGDELVFRIAVAEDGAFDGSEDAWLAVASRFLPYAPVDAIEIDEFDARAPRSGPRTCTGRIKGLSKRFAALLELKSLPRFKERRHLKFEPGTPSAIPSPPSPPPPDGPRSGTPAERRSGGSPKPPR